MTHLVIYKDSKGSCKVVVAMPGELKDIRRNADNEKQDGTDVRVISITGRSRREHAPSVGQLIRLIEWLDECHGGCNWTVVLEDLAMKVANAAIKL